MHFECLCQETVRVFWLYLQYLCELQTHGYKLKINNCVRNISKDQNNLLVDFLEFEKQSESN